jgi:putative transposase
VGIPQHVIQRGNNRQVCFNADEDYAAYAHWLKAYANKYHVQVHAWIFMTNHVHLLVTPIQQNAVSQMMQSLGRCYVRYYNKTYQRSGTLWEGRFKFCVVESAEYLLQCYRYIELNPVRASMVADPSEYHWSSYKSNGLGVYTPLITPHNEYLRLGDSDEARLHQYRQLFKYHLDDNMITEIRDSVNKGLVLGSDKFKDEIEFNLKRRVRAGTAGRKPKEMTPITRRLLTAT